MFRSGLHVVVSKSSNYQASVVFGSGLHVGVSKRSNFLASGCVWVGLTHGGVENE